MNANRRGPDEIDVERVRGRETETKAGGEGNGSAGETCPNTSTWACPVSRKSSVIKVGVPEI